MILEAIEWCLTPASIAARRSGLLSEQIAIRHRARRCRHSWKSHLHNAKAAIARQCPPGLAQSVVVLGSGHLNDVDLDMLLEKFERVTLVDILHPIEIRLRAAVLGERVSLLATDVGGVVASALEGSIPASVAISPALTHCVEEADLVISANLLSQLMVTPAQSWRTHGVDDATIDALGAMVLNAHLDLLRSARRAVLISDRAARLVSEDIACTWQDLLYGITLPKHEAEWVWQIATPKERGDGLAEQRSVVAIPFAK